MLLKANESIAAPVYEKSLLLEVSISTDLLNTSLSSIIPVQNDNS
jgi:hypothetical protein